MVVSFFKWQSFSNFKNIISFNSMTKSLDHNGSPKLPIFWWFLSGIAILCYHYETFEITFFISVLMRFKEEKSRKLHERKNKIHLLKNVKFHFCIVFRLINTILSTILWQDLCMKMIWLQADFCFVDIYITLSFQIKNIKFPKFCQWVFVPLKCQQNFEILQLVLVLTLNTFWT